MKEMQIYQSRSFEKRVKKLQGNEKSILDKEIQEIAQDPSIGVGKQGELRGVFVHKFKIKTLLYLLSCRYVEDGIELITFGSHENYYRELKLYIKNR